jgi:hypothetical protein
MPGEVQEIAELLVKADHHAATEYQDRYREMPPVLYRVQDIGRLGFENLIQAVQVAPAYDVPVYLGFTSSKVTLTVGDLFSISSDQVSVYDWASGIGRRFKYREIHEDLMRDERLVRE